MSGKTFPYVSLAVMRPRNLHMLSGTLRMTGAGYQRRMPKRLKKRWQSATCIASTGLEVATVAPMMPVRVVPTLAPRVSGNISSREMSPTAAIGVRVEVVMEEDCTMIVMNMPTTMLR